MTKTTYLRPYINLRKRLVELRISVGCSQEELGKRLGQPQSYVSKVESGERRLDLVEYVYWTKALEIEPTELIQRLSDEIGSVGRGGIRRANLVPDDIAS